MSQTLTIRGGRPLAGTVQISGAKNAATKMMIASLLTAEPVILHNCPRIDDVAITAELCRAVGAQIDHDGQTLRLHTPKLTNTTVGQLSRSNRLPILALAPLLARAGRGAVPVVSGDHIGPRPVNFHLNALHHMGAEIEQTETGYRAHTTGLRGVEIELPYPSVGATENSLLAAALATGTTRIHNAAIEPEVVDLVALLQAMGARISRPEERVWQIEGVKQLHGAEYRIMPDRLEAASFGLLSAATGGQIIVQGVRLEDLETFLAALGRAGVEHEVTSAGLRLYVGKPGLRGITLETDVHPGFATDWQQPASVLLTQAQGRSTIHETVYEDRFGYTADLVRMGARIEVLTQCLGHLRCRFQTQAQFHSAIIDGPTPLAATDIVIPDIRAGMAQVMAALVAQGTSRLQGVDHLLRGYQDFSAKLQQVGADARFDD